VTKKGSLPVDEPTRSRTKLVRGTSRRPDEWPSILATQIRSAPLSARGRRDRARRMWKRVALAGIALAVGASLWFWAWPSIAGFLGGD
jgi:hypothetical protein